MSANERCDGRCPGAEHFQCEREAGHPGFHRYGDERVPSGALVWHPTDALAAFSDHLKVRKDVTIPRGTAELRNPDGSVAATIRGIE